jgi:uncharacterized ParB-like nuclease family protein
MKKTKTINLSPDSIEATKKTQVRLRLCPDSIDDYARDMSNGAIFPPIVVFAQKGTERYILADGFHRLSAAIRLKKKEVEVEVCDGGPDDALRYALSANTKNGIRRTNADKTHAVKMALATPAFKDLSLRDLADMCCVSHTFVRVAKDSDLREAEVKRKAKPTPKKVDDAERPETNGRATKEPPSQETVELGELRQALGIIRSFPYDGIHAAGTLKLNKDDLKSLEYVSEWLTVMNTTVRF